MKEMTGQLFEYLLAAKNSSGPTNQRLSDSQEHWFLDELIQLDNVHMMEDGADVSHIEVVRPTYEKPEKSLLLTEVFRVLGSDEPEVEPEQLGAILSKEYELLKAKLNKEKHELVDLSQWQKLLLNVSTDQLPVFMVMNKITCCDRVIKDLVLEYQAWLTGKGPLSGQSNEELYAHLKKIQSSQLDPQKLALGVGILRLPSTPAVFQPILTMEVDVEVDPYGEVCRISLKDKSLKIEEDLLDHALFHDPEGANYLKAEINRRLILPFDNDVVGEALQKIVTMIHPQGQYITSSRDMECINDGLPTIFHRSVLFTKRVEVDRSIGELKEAIRYLEHHEQASDVVQSIVDSEHRPDSMATAEWKRRVQTTYPLSSDGAEEMIMNALATNYGVVVNETCSDSKINAIANLIIHFTSLGQRTLIMSQDGGELLKIQARLPHYLKDMQRFLTLDERQLTNTPESQIDHRSVFSEEMHQLVEEIAAVDEKIETLRTQLARHRELRSNKILWKDNYYYPYELSQFLAKLGEPGYVIPAPIPMDVHLKASRLDLQKMWDFRSDFTAENLELLNYEFINVGDVLKDEEYQLLLMAEKRYLTLMEEFEESGTLLDGAGDFGFIQYLHDKLPPLMQNVSGIADDYEYSVLMDAITSLERYRQLTRLLDQFSDQIDRLASFLGTESELKQLIGDMNQAFFITSDAPEVDLSQKTYILEFYIKKRLLMSQALQKAHGIWIFNEESRTLFSEFKGISATNLPVLDSLYHGALVHLAKVDFETGWAYVSEHFINKYQSDLERPDLHPVCIEWYEALQNRDIESFKATLQKMKDLTTIRENFINFADLSAQMGEAVPNFVSTLLSEESTEKDMPDYHGAFDYTQLTTFFERLHEKRLSDLEDRLLGLRGQKQKLVDQLAQKKCWATARHQDLPICFMPTTDQPWEIGDKRSSLEMNSNSFDVAIFTDASKQSIFDLGKLMFANKAILFGRRSDATFDHVTLDDIRSQKMSDRYGSALHRFGDQYLTDSLFGLIAHATAWNARIELPSRLNQGWLDTLVATDSRGIKKYDNTVEEEIFEALFKKGYELRSKINVGSAMLDMVVVGKTNKVAINIIGDTTASREETLAQIEQEMQLRELGLDIYNLSATEFYLNSRQVLQEVSDYLGRLGIQPKMRNYLL